MKWLLVGTTGCTLILDPPCDPVVCDPFVCHPDGGCYDRCEAGIVRCQTGFACVEGTCVALTTQWGTSPRDDGSSPPPSE